MGLFSQPLPEGRGSHADSQLESRLPPVILTTVNVATGLNQPTIPQIKKALPGQPEIDRTSVNSLEDKEFQEAVKALGRKKLVVCALWTEVCLCFPALDLLKEGYEIGRASCRERV